MANTSYFSYSHADMLLFLKDKSVAKLQGYLISAIGEGASEDDPYSVAEMQDNMCNLADTSGGGVTGLLSILETGVHDDLRV